MSFLPLLEVSSDLVTWPRSVLTHLDLEADSEVPSTETGSLIGKISRNGNIAAIAKVSKESFEFSSTILNFFVH